MKYKDIDLAGLDIEIDIEAAKAFIDHRINKKAKLTQRTFDQQMRKSLSAYQIGLTPTELIDDTMESGWTGININYTAAKKSREMAAMQEAMSTRSTRSITLEEEMNNTDWAN